MTRALERRPVSAQRRKIWVLPAFTLGIGNSVDTGSHGVTLHLMVGGWFVLCLLVGVCWQSVYRRDLVDRFLLLVVLFVVGMAVGLLVGSVDVHDHGTVFSGLTLPSIAAGVILTEKRLRSRELL